MADKHVALLIETSRSYGRGLLKGIIRYQREHGPWSIYFEPRGVHDSAPRWLRSWRGDGILARIADRPDNLHQDKEDQRLPRQTANKMANGVKPDGCAQRVFGSVKDRGSATDPCVRQRGNFNHHVGQHQKE